MAKFFNYFPKTFYSNDDNAKSLNVITNIITRFTFENKLKENSVTYYSYLIQDGDTPDIIARKFYGSSERHWIVLMFNDIIDPQYDWPLTYQNFNEFIDMKYSGPEYANTTTKYVGIEWASSNDYLYYKVITKTSADNTTIEKYEIDYETFINLPETSNEYVLPDGVAITETITKETKTYYQYEQDLNESKRTIKLLKPEFVSAVEAEFKRVIK